MKRQKLSLLIALLAFLPSINGCKDADMEAELAARNARLDELEKQDQAIRDILYGKLNALRGKLLPIIDEVEANLKKRIDNETDQLIYTIGESVASMNKRIDDSFADAQAYVDKNMKGCYDDINDSFSSLFECKQAVDDGLRKAVKDHNSDLEALLRKYEKQIDGILDRADVFQSKLKDLESTIKRSEEIDLLLDDYHSRCLDLQDTYSEMEEQEAKLLAAMGKLVSQEYLASLEVDQIHELQDLLSHAESVVDDLEAYKSAIESDLSDNDGTYAEMWTLAEIVEGDLTNILADAVGYGESMRSMADDIQASIAYVDAEYYLDTVESSLAEIEDEYDAALDLMFFADDLFEGLKNYSMQMSDEVGDYLSAAEALFEEAIAEYFDLEPYMNF